MELLVDERLPAAHVHHELARPHHTHPIRPHLGSSDQFSHAEIPGGLLGFGQRRSHYIDLVIIGKLVARVPQNLAGECIFALHTVFVPFSRGLGIK